MMKTTNYHPWIILISAILIAVVAYIFWPKIILGSSASATPSQVVEMFYDWYLNYIGDPSTNDFQNPLINGAYRDSRYLTKDFINQIDRQLDSGNFFQADPFLCAQDIPEDISVLSAYHTDDHARVLVESNFHRHYFTVDLNKKWGQWKISNITCGATPEGLVYAFYTWYLGYLGNPTQGELNNPLVDRAYQSSQYLSLNFIKIVDEYLDDNTLGGFDPFLLAQDLPSDFQVEHGPKEDTCVVHLQFGENFTKSILVYVIREDGIIFIDCVEEEMQ
jgi:hypothetical protein